MIKLFEGINDVSNNVSSFWFLHKKSKATKKKGGGKHALPSHHFLVYLLSNIKMLEYKYLKDTLLFLLLTHPCVNRTSW